MKKVIVLGCTGSIGLNTLEIIKQMQDEFSVASLVAHKNKQKLEKLKTEFSCKGELTSENENCIKELLQETKPDIAVNGIAGSDGLIPSKLVIEAGVDLALANKETVVMAWHLISSLAKKNNVNIIPVDSEHSAIFNLMNQIGKENISQIILTASGGPFRNYTKEQLENVTVEDALKHPTWNMGKKITIDSATLANKGLEVIEACKLFDIPTEKIEVLVHPQSIVHSLVRTNDGMLYAQLSMPDMKHPILSALNWPNNKNNFLEQFDLFDKTLSFSKARLDDFPMLHLAYEVAKKGASYTIAYNAADEIAANAFLEGLIPFQKIAYIVNDVLSRDWTMLPQDFESVFTIDKQARDIAEKLL